MKRENTINFISLIVIAFCLPFVLWAVCGILPTFDDYTSLQSPWWVQIADPGYFFPDAVRRPFDALLGAIVGWQPSLFPTLNHVLIIFGHTAAACLVFAICRQLNMSMLASNIATLFFFFSPASLGVTLACDGFNQTYAQFWGLLALWLYLRGKRLWLLCVVMAVLSKENGLAWAIVPPIVGYAFEMTNFRRAAHDVGKGMLLAVIYAAVLYTVIHSGLVGIDYPEEYFESSLMTHLKDFAQVLAYTWMPLDYVSAVYPPTRNWLIVAVTALMAMPFLLVLSCQWRQLLTRRLLLLIACFIILVSPHLLTVMSIMNNYAALSIAAIIVAVLLSQPTANGIRQATFPTTKYGSYAFALFMAASLFTDVHHYIAARESGLLGKRLAMQAIEKAEEPVSKAFVINIDDPEEPRYSNFCVRSVDAFAWGLSVRHYSHYEWKTSISEITLSQFDQRQVETLADSALHDGCEAVWVVNHDLQVIHR